MSIKVLFKKTADMTEDELDELQDRLYDIRMGFLYAARTTSKGLYYVSIMMAAAAIWGTYNFQKYGIAQRDKVIANDVIARTALDPSLSPESAHYEAGQHYDRVQKGAERALCAGIFLCGVMASLFAIGHQRANEKATQIYQAEMRKRMQQPSFAINPE